MTCNWKRNYFCSICQKIKFSRWDYLEIREGGRSDSPLLGRFCGDQIPPDFVSRTNEIFVKFKSDHSISGSGFRIRYEVGELHERKSWAYIFLSCFFLNGFLINTTACGGEYTTPSGIITSPYHPNNYPRNRQCDYIIAQPVGTYIHLEFMDFDIEDASSCRWDYLQVTCLKCTGQNVCLREGNFSQMRDKLTPNKTSMKQSHFYILFLVKLSKYRIFSL